MTALEESWGDHLMSIHKPDMAVSHYIEAGKMSVALKAAIDAQQWQRAADIIDVVGEDNVPAEHYSLLGRYYASVRMYDPAEKFFTLAKLPVEVIKMHVAAGHFFIILLSSIYQNVAICHHSMIDRANLLPFWMCSVTNSKKISSKTTH